MQTDTKSTPNIHSMLSDDAKTLRSYLLDKLIELNRPVYPREIDKEEKFDVTITLKELTDKGLVASKDDGSIVGVYPVSALPTLHKVQQEFNRYSYFRAEKPCKNRPLASSIL